MSANPIPVTGPSASAMPNRNRKLGAILGIVVACMFLFAPVLYITGDLICDALGIGVNPAGDPQGGLNPVVNPNALAEVQDVDEEDRADVSARTVRVVFAPHTDRLLEGRIAFTVDEAIQQHTMLGLTFNQFTLTNYTDDVLFILPIHSVVPNRAAMDFIMGQCFCYTALRIEPGETRLLDVTYGFKPELDRTITSAQVGYDLRMITEAEYNERIAAGNPKHEATPAPTAGGQP